MKFLFFAFFVCFLSQAQAQTIAQPTEVNAMSAENTFYNLQPTALMGEPFPFEKLLGKIVIVLNVASECGYTPQYADWQRFYEANAEHGVEVIGVPCNQFGEQEPGGEKEIGAFCQKNYGVTFTMLQKADVSGENTSELYRFLTNPDLNGWNKEAPSWNFCKYVINREGKLVAYFPSKVLPGDDAFIETLSKL